MANKAYDQFLLTAWNRGLCAAEIARSFGISEKDVVIRIEQLLRSKRLRQENAKKTLKRAEKRAGVRPMEIIKGAA